MGNKLEIFRDANVLVTGNTGFKGAWLAFWLHKLGANVAGVSNLVPTKPSLFESLRSSELYRTFFMDINETEKLANLISETKPQFLFHLAAQSLVEKGYSNPLETWRTNTLGTASVLEALSTSTAKGINAVFITSDKVYKNNEWAWGYRENDEMGGVDPYGNSKAAAELVIKSYVESLRLKEKSVSIASVRAGNVVGGGDWSEGRIVPDAIKAWLSEQPLHLRSPNSTRPWQHVLEPLGGYLLVASKLKENKIPTGQSFNLGPSELESKTVFDLVTKLGESLHGLHELTSLKDNEEFAENNLLRLSSELALKELSWKSLLTFEETVSWIGEWYSEYKLGHDLRDVTARQINEYSDRFNSLG